jgi:DNA modification methylase
MVIKKDKSVSHKEKKDMAILNIAELNLISQDSPYQLYNKSSLVMNEVENNSVRLCLNSHPYMKLRKYRNQESLRHGRESSREKYIANFRLFNAEVFKKLLPGGVLVTIIGETYKGGYKGICSHAELALEEIGYKIIDVVIWVKNNQQYAPHPFRFQNSYERIIVAVKPGAKPIFNEVLRKGSVEKFKVKKTSNDSFYLARPETCITNVITSDTHNPAELRVVDPHFFHDGPAPLAIYRPFIEAYSCPGDLIMDNFVGSGTIGVGLEMGRRVIGYDVDPVSIEFCHKRFEYFLKGEPKMDLTVAA